MFQGMRARQILVVFFLIILPTGVLSIMAHLALENREAALRARLRAAAESSIEAVSARLQANIYGDMNQVRATLHEYLQRTARFRDIESTALRLKRTIPLVERVYLFMDPWELIYPAGRLQPDREEVYEQHRGMLSVLRKTVSERQGDKPFLFKANGDAYCFVLLPERTDLYGGYKVDPKTFSAVLKEAIRMESGRGFRIKILETESEKTPLRRPETDESANSQTVLVEKHLFSPFEHVRLAGILEGGALAGDSQWQPRLYEWGIGLLFVFICGGTFLALVLGAEEVRKARARSDFLVGVSHDLRTPVSSMKMLSESLLEGRVKDPDKKQRFLATIAGESEKLSQLIERVIYFVRLGQNALVYNRTKIDAAETVRNSVDSFKARYRNKAPQIDLRLPESIPPVSADKGAVTQVLLNLLDNAARYGSKKPGMQSQTGEGNEFGAARISVRVQAETRKKNLLAAPQQWVRFDVTDFGPGIARFQRRRIFRRYYRAQETKQSNISGVGLGLALCSHIVRAHGGWMEVRSQTGKGSTFSFYLPGG